MVGQMVELLVDRMVAKMVVPKVAWMVAQRGRRKVEQKELR